MSASSADHGTKERVFYVIADEDTVLGFRYAGVPGAAVSDEEAARAALAGVIASKRYDLIILTEPVAELMRDEVTRVRFEAHGPVVVVIPGPKGPSPSRQDLMKLIQEAVGLKL